MSYFSDLHAQQQEGCKENHYPALDGIDLLDLLEKAHEMIQNPNLFSRDDMEIFVDYELRPVMDELKKGNQQ